MFGSRPVQPGDSTASTSPSATVTSRSTSRPGVVEERSALVPELSRAVPPAETRLHTTGTVRVPESSRLSGRRQFRSTVDTRSPDVLHSYRCNVTAHTGNWPRVCCDRGGVLGRERLVGRSFACGKAERLEFQSDTGLWPSV